MSRRTADGESPQPGNFVISGLLVEARKIFLLEADCDFFHQMDSS